MADASRDNNRVTTLLGISFADGVTPVPIYADPVTHRLLVQGSGSGSVSPLTTKGDIWVFGTADTRLPVGTNNQFLIADSTQATGLKWSTLSLNLSQISAPTSVYDFGAQRLTNLGTPTASTDAVTKQYADLLAQGFTVKPTALIGTTTLAASTVSNPTITANANGAFPTTNGYTPVINDVIFYNAGNAASGLYTLTQVGSGSLPWILTRHVNMDASGEFMGAMVLVDTTDNTNGGKAYICNLATPPTVGTTAITFTQLFSPNVYTAGTGLTLTSGTFAIDSTVMTLTGTQSASNKTFTSATLVTPTLGVATATSVAASGLVSAGSISTTGTITETISGTPTTLTNPSLQATNSVNNFTQISIQNKSATANSSADLIAYPDNNSNDSTGFADMGMTSSAFSQAAYVITGANNGYFFVSAVSGASKPGNMVIATDGTGTSNEIVFYTGGFDSLTRERLRITASGTRFGLVGTSTGTLLLSGATSGTTTITAAASGGGAITLPVSGTLMSDTSANTVQGIKSYNDATLKLNGVTSGAVTLKAPAVASTYVHTLPAMTTTIASVGSTTEASNTATVVAIAGIHHTHIITALAAANTFGVPTVATGALDDTCQLIIRIKDNATARVLAWNAIFRASSDLALPTTTIVSKTLYLGFKYNVADTKWDLIAVLNNF